MRIVVRTRELMARNRTAIVRGEKAKGAQNSLFMGRDQTRVRFHDEVMARDVTDPANHDLRRDARQERGLIH